MLAIQNIDLQLAEEERRIETLAAPESGTFIGKVYVVFHSKDMAAKVLAFENSRWQTWLIRCRDKNRLKFDADRPAEPSDINWENLAMSKAERCKRKFGTVFIGSVIVIGCLVVIYLLDEWKKRVIDTDIDAAQEEGDLRSWVRLTTLSLLSVGVISLFGRLAKRTIVFTSAQHKHSTYTTQMYETTMGVIIVRVLLNTFIPAIIAIFGHAGIKAGGYSNIYKPGALIEEVSFVMLFLTFYEALLYLISPYNIWKKRKRFFCVKKSEDGKLDSMSQAEANRLWEKHELDVPN